MDKQVQMRLERIVDSIHKDQTQIRRLEKQIMDEDHWLCMYQMECERYKTIANSIKKMYEKIDILSDNLNKSYEELGKEEINHTSRWTKRIKSILGFIGGK